MSNHLHLFLLTFTLSNKLGFSLADLSHLQAGCNHSEFRKPLITVISSQGESLPVIGTQLIVPPNVTSFTMNCTFHKLPKWDIANNTLPTKLVLGETIVHYSPSNLAARTKCYSVNLIFYDVREEITASYICSETEKYNNHINVQLFSGRRSNDSLGFLLRRGRIDTLFYDVNETISMDCQVTVPSVQVEFYYSHQLKSNSSGWKLIPKEFIRSLRFPGEPALISPSVIAQSLSTFFMKCQTNILGDVYILKIRFKDFDVGPKQGVTEILTLPTWARHDFSCEANNEVSIRVEDPIPDVKYYEHFNSVAQGYKKAPFIRQFVLEYIGSDHISNKVGVIQCNSNNRTLHSWKHRLYVDTSFTSFGLSVDPKTRTATCATIAVNDARLLFVTASTREEIMFKKHCINVDAHFTCPDQLLLSPVELTPISISVYLPPVSGLISCISLDDVDTSIQYFLNTDETTISIQTSRIDFPYAENVSHEISCYKNDLKETNSLECKCSFTKTLFALPIIPLVTKSNETVQLGSFAEIQFIPTEFQKRSFHYKAFRVNIDSPDVLKISCLGFSSVSAEFYFSTWIIVRPTSQWSETTIVAVTVTSVAIFLLIFIIIFLVIKYKFQKPSTTLTNSEIVQFREGNHNVLGESGFENAQKIAFADTIYELDVNSLTINQSILGIGAYGVVVKGSIKAAGDTVAQDVAVKMLKPGTHIDYLKSLLRELKVMAYIGNHPHVAELIGAVTNKLTDNEIFVVLKYYCNGSLGDYLKKNRNHFVHSSTEDCEDFEELMKPDNLVLGISERQTFTLHDLVQWSYDITVGMDYLVSKKIIHGDLAARNILLDENRHIKISDFGLARQLYNYSLYVKKSKVPLPWRWMSIEAMCDMAFSSKSDVWAYGVTVWEIFSLGLLPFPAINWDDKFIKFLTDGHRLARPTLASHEIYNSVMYPTWNSDTEARPTFLELSQSLERFLPDSTYLEIAQ